MQRDSNQSLMVIVYVGMMAAMIFVATYFFKFEIMTPTGPVMIKTANILCLLAGMLFGGFLGGLSAGIGSMLFDLMDPKYAATAPFTLCFFFFMGMICGMVSHSGSARGDSFARNAIGATLGALTYFVLNSMRNVMELVVAGSTFVPAIIASMPKLAVSAINLFVGIAGSLALVRLIYQPLKRAGILARFQ